MRGWTAAVAFVLVISTGATCSESTQRPGPLPRGILTITTGVGRVTLSMEIARTPQARTHGLMERRSLPPDAGMAFLFGRPNRGGFWMRNTPIPLSIAFWGSDRRIVGMLEMTPCHADPCPLYSPGIPYRGAVEANRGWFARHGVRVGDQIRLTGS
jgi:uncharacterized membrane protein (UPF0127 family)